MSRYSCDDQYIQKRVDALNSLLKKSRRFGTDQLTLDQLLNGLLQAEKIAYACRVRLDELEYQEETTRQEHSRIAGSGLVETGVVDGFMAVRVPCFFNRRAKDTWYLKVCIEDSVETFLKENGKVVDVTQRLVFAYVRMSERIDSRMMDNDNVEAHQAGDAIASALGITDGPFRVQHYFTTIHTKERTGSYIYVVPETEFPVWWNRMQEISLPVLFKEFWPRKEIRYGCTEQPPEVSKDGPQPYQRVLPHHRQRKQPSDKPKQVEKQNKNQV